jgi:hypothetical protein
MAMKSADGRSAPSWCVSSAPAASAAKGRPRPARYSHLGCLILGALAMSASGLARTAQAAPVVAGSGVPASSADAASRIFEAAQFRKDRTTLDRMLAPSYLFVHGSGKVGDRADFLAAFADPAETFTAFAITHRVIIPVGPDGAIVAAEANVSGAKGGAAFTQHFRYDDTYARTAGAWRVLYTQVTVLPR